MRAPYFAIEGLDGSGGTTQAEHLAERLQGLGPVVRTREPSGGPVGRLLRAELAGGVVGDAVLPYLFAADRRDHLDRVVLPALARGSSVVSDRCVLSSLAYQAASLGLLRVLELNADFRPPDRIVMLVLSPEASLERIARRGLARERFESLERLRSTEAAYHVAIETCRDIGWDIVEIDASGSVEEVAAAVWASAGEVLAWQG
jgi:dTMP kinase